MIKFIWYASHLAFHMLSHLILTGPLGGQYYQPSFLGEETERLRDLKTN